MQQYLRTNSQSRDGPVGLSIQCMTNQARPNSILIRAAPGTIRWVYQVIAKGSQRWDWSKFINNVIIWSYYTWNWISWPETWSSQPLCHHTLHSSSRQRGSTAMWQWCSCTLSCQTWYLGTHQLLSAEMRKILRVKDANKISSLIFSTWGTASNTVNSMGSNLPNVSK